MNGSTATRPGVLQWVVVLVVGILVATVVLGLNLISRLNAGQKVLDAARPAFTSDRLAGTRAGIDFISADVDTADPLMTPAGGAAAEVPKLVAFVSQETGLSRAAVVAALGEKFPHTLALLQTLPLSAVTAELPGLFAFLESALDVTEAQLLEALQANFPALTQAITNLPTVTSGWESIQEIGGLTRFDGSAVKTVPQLRDYFSSDLIPVLETQQSNYQSIDGKSTWTWIAPLLLAVALTVVAVALVMIALDYRQRATPRIQKAGAGLVITVGVGVVALSLGLSLVPRVENGQRLLDALRPATTAQRVAGDRAGITMVSAIVDTEDPIMTPAGGAAAEVPKLVAFVSEETGLSRAAVVAALGEKFPHTLALLQTLPLSAVTAELPGLFAFLESALQVTEAQLLEALQANFPALTQAITNLPTVTSGWESIQEIGGLTRFDGSAVKTVPQLRDYLSSDLIPVLETQRRNYDKLVQTSRIDFIGPLVLAVGIVVVLYGLLMLFLARRPERGQAVRTSPETVAA